jgi:hypothetical protein
MNIRPFIALFLLTLSAVTFCASLDGHKKPQLVAVVRIRSLELRPKLQGESFCPANPVKKGENGVETFCIDNSCGKEIAQLRVEKTLLGEPPHGDLVLHAYMGEWCRPRFPLTSQMLIVVYDIDGEDDRFDFMELAQAKNGELFFTPDHEMDFAGIPLQGLISPVQPAEQSIYIKPTDQQRKYFLENKIGCADGENIVVCGGVTVKSWLQVLLHSQQSKKAS